MCIGMCAFFSYFPWEVTTLILIWQQSFDSFYYLDLASDANHLFYPLKIVLLLFGNAILSIMHCNNKV